MKILLASFLFLILISSCKKERDMPQPFIEYRDTFCGTFTGTKISTHGGPNFIFPPDTSIVNCEISKSLNNDSIISTGFTSIKILPNGHGYESGGSSSLNNSSSIVFIDNDHVTITIQLSSNTDWYHYNYTLQRVQ